MTTHNEIPKDTVEEILKGIDKDCESDDGWWETSTGAEFGAKKLAEIKSFIEKERTTAYNKGVEDGKAHPLTRS
jgi:hypothetical protein